MESNNTFFIVIFIIIILIFINKYFYKSNNTPFAKTPIAKTPIANTPIANTPIANTPIATNCFVSNWRDCNGTEQKRTVIQATNGGTGCTTEQNIISRSCGTYATSSIADNNFIETETIPGCSITGWSDCSGGMQNREIKGVGCSIDARNAEVSRQCNGRYKDIYYLQAGQAPGCSITGWSDCSGGMQNRKLVGEGCSVNARNGYIYRQCNSINDDIRLIQAGEVPGCSITGWSDCSGGMQYREIKGVGCSENARKAQVARSCNNCIVDRWSNCSDGMQNRSVTSHGPGGIPCTVKQNIKSRTCDPSPASWENPHSGYPGCYIGDWSECINERQFRDLDGCYSDDKKYRLPEQRICASEDNYITVYPEPNYQGTGVKLYPPSWYNMYTLKVLKLNDKTINSIKLQPNIRASIWEGSHFTGNYKIITSDESNLANIDFDNRTSSIRVELIKYDILGKEIPDPDEAQWRSSYSYNS